MFINLNFQFGFCYFIFRTSDLGLFLTFWNRFLERFIISQIYNFLRFKMIKKLVVWKIIYGVQICTEVLTLLKTASFHISRFWLSLYFLFSISYYRFFTFDYLFSISHFDFPVFDFPYFYLMLIIWQLNFD